MWASFAGFSIACRLCASRLDVVALDQLLHTNTHTQKHMLLPHRTFDQSWSLLSKCPVGLLLAMPFAISDKEVALLTCLQAPCVLYLGWMSVLPIFSYPIRNTCFPDPLVVFWLSCLSALALRIHCLDYISQTSSSAFQRETCFSGWVVGDDCCLGTSVCICACVSNCLKPWLPYYSSSAKDLWMLDMFAGAAGISRAFSILPK